MTARFGIESAGMTQDIDPRLLDILICPVSRQPLRYDAKAQELISDAAGLAYPIRAGVPIMIADEARQLEDTGA